MNHRNLPAVFGRCRNRILAGWLLLPSLAMAHPGHFHPGEDDEFDAIVAGFLHPFSGLDHLVLAVAAGWLACALGKRDGRALAGAFLTAIAAGAVAGRGASAGSGLEIAIAITLLGAGAVLLGGRMPRIGLLAGAAAVAGFIHGFAHGAESMPVGSFGCCAAGFLAGTAALLGVGGGLHHAATRHPTAPRWAGIALLAMGSLALWHSI